MGVINWIGGLLGKKGTFSLTTNDFELANDYYFKKLAVDTCVDLIANTLVRCEFQTFEKGVEVRKDNYYLFNVQPNQNQNSSEFIHSLVSHLVYNNECLVIMHNDQLYIADDFTRIEYALRENYYTDVTINNFTFSQRTFKESEVFYFKLSDKNIMSVIDSVYGSWGKLITSSIGIYKRSNTIRAILKGDFLRGQTDEQQKKLDDMFNTQFKSWFEADKAGAVFNLQKGFELDVINSDSKGNKINSRDIKALIDDVFDFVSIGFHIPKGMLKGDVVDVSKQTDNYLMFCINPIVELIADEANRKYYTKEQYLERTYIKIDTQRIKQVDMTDLATACDIFFRIGVNTINDNLHLLGREPIPEEIGDKRAFTKNYETIEMMNSKGGENNGDTND